MNGATDVFSPSRLSQFENCPKKFEYRYVQRIEAESESVEGFLGKRVHEVLERLYRVTSRGRGVPSLARVLERFGALWQEHFDPERVRVVREEAHVELYRAHGERCLENYYRRHYPFDADETLGVEQRVRFSLDADGQYRMQGIIDRLVEARDGALEIHDYKTGVRVPSQARLDRDRQLALYQMGIAERHGGERPVRLVWHYLFHNQERRSTRTPEQLARLRTRTMRLIDKIRAETEFAAKPGPLCAWCEYRDRCPAQAGESRPTPVEAPPTPAAPAAAPAAETPRRQLTLW